MTIWSGLARIDEPDRVQGVVADKVGRRDEAVVVYAFGVFHIDAAIVVGDAGRSHVVEIRLHDRIGGGADHAQLQPMTQHIPRRGHRLMNPRGHGLQLQIERQSLLAVLPTPSRLLISAQGHREVADAVSVYAQIAGFDKVSQMVGLVQITRPDAGGQTELRAIGESGNIPPQTQTASPRPPGRKSHHASCEYLARRRS